MFWKKRNILVVNCMLYISIFSLCYISHVFSCTSPRKKFWDINISVFDVKKTIDDIIFYECNMMWYYGCYCLIFISLFITLIIFDDEDDIMILCSYSHLSVVDILLRWFHLIVYNFIKYHDVNYFKINSIIFDEKLIVQIFLHNLSLKFRDY